MSCGGVVVWTGTALGSCDLCVSEVWYLCVMESAGSERAIAEGRECWMSRFSIPTLRALIDVAL